MPGHPLAQAEASLNEVNWIIPHQANLRIIQSAAAGEFWRGADLGVGGVADRTVNGVNGQYKNGVKAVVVQ